MLHTETMPRARHVTLVSNTGWSMVRFRAELISALVAQGLKVSLIAAFDEQQQRQMRSLGAQPLALEIDAAGINPWRDLAYASRLVVRLCALRPDVVHLFTLKPVLYGGLAARLLGIRGIVASVTGSGILRAEGKRWLARLIRLPLRAALHGRARTIFQNQADLAAFVADGLVEPEQAVCILGSGVDTEALAPDPELPFEARKTFVVACRMLWSKGVADFVEAARRVRQEFPEASFVLYGGAREDYLSKNPDFIERSWLEQVDREGVVAWRGFTDPAEVEQAMRRAAAVVLPSYYAEGVPRCLIEAAAAGTPIITTDLPGRRETLIEGRSGFLCPPHSPDRLAAAMAELLRRPGLIESMGREGRRLAVSTFDKRIVIEQTLSIYEQAMACRSGQGA